MSKTILSVTVTDGKFQIWEEIDDQESFSFILCEGKTAITDSQKIANLIGKTLTETKEEMPVFITISDDEVLFTRGNISFIMISEDSPNTIYAVLTCGRTFSFKEKEATKFLNHFPYSYFENAKNLADLYTAIWTTVPF